MQVLGHFLAVRVIVPLVVFVGKHLMGWGMQHHFPHLPKYIILAEHHTSNYDILALLFAAAHEKRRLRYIVKQEAQHWFIVGRMLKWSGAIFIDRDAPLSAIKTIIRTVRESDECALLISPKGTRAYTDGWKSGFYYLAQKLDLPMVAGSPDYVRKLVVMGEPFKASGDIEADIAALAGFYAQQTPRHPELAAPVRLLPQIAAEKSPSL